MKRKTKREMVLDIYDREAMGEVTAREIGIINQALIAEFGEGGAMDPGEIARILVDEDLPVRFTQIFRMSTLSERFENAFRNLPRTTSLAQAEASLREIAALYRKYQRAGNQTGLRFARETVLAGKTKALQAAADTSKEERFRAEQAEIAQWFTIWLQTPDLFDQWLQLRQTTVEYRSKFGLRSPES
jgi:hypothetical protein